MRVIKLRGIASSTRLAQVSLIGLGIIAAATIGSATPDKGVQVVGWAALPFVALLVFSRPALGLLLVVATFPIENTIVVLGGENTFSYLLSLAVGGAWIARKIAQRESFHLLLSTTVFKVTIAFLGLALASALWATDPSEVRVGAFQWFRLFLLTLMVIDLIRSWKWIDWLVKALVLTAIVASILTIRQYFVLGFDRAGDEIAGGGNATAAVLTMIVPFAFYLIYTQGSVLWRLVGAAYLGLGVVAIAVTFSRASYILLSLLLLIQFWEIIKKQGHRKWPIFVLGLVLVVAVLVVPWEALLARGGTIMPYLQETVGLESSDPAVVADRAYLLRVGLVVFAHNPILGVGYNNWEAVWKSYVFYVPGAYEVQGGNAPPHNSHVAMMAELGIIGGVLWIAILGVAVRSLYVALSRLGRPVDSPEFLLTRATLYGLLLAIGYGWARPIQGEKLFWLFVGLSAVMLHLTSQQDAAPDTG